MPRFPAQRDVPPVTVGGFPAVWTTAWEDIGPGFGVYVLADPDAPLEALEEAIFEAQDERMPYFASLWPSGASLGACVLNQGVTPRARVLELGCGVGAPGLAAAVQGAEVTFSDWEPLALDLVGHAAQVLGVTPADRVTADWRTWKPDRSFELVLGADLLYEARNVPAVLAALARLLVPGGEAWIADPGRAGLEPFVAGLALHGLELLDRSRLPARPHGVDVSRLRVVRYGDGP